MPKQAHLPSCSRRPPRLPLIWSADAVLFPECTLVVKGLGGLSAAEAKAAEEGHLELVVAAHCRADQPGASADVAPAARIPKIATRAKVLGLVRLPDGASGLFLRGVARVVIVGAVTRAGRTTVLVSPCVDHPYRRTEKLDANVRRLKTAALHLTSQWGMGGDKLRAVDVDDPATVVALSQAILPVDPKEKLGWLHELDVKVRVTAVLLAASRELARQGQADASTRQARRRRANQTALEAPVSCRSQLPPAPGAASAPSSLGPLG